MPNIRSDGARRTAAPITRTMTAATADTASASASCARTRHHRGKDDHRAGNSPTAYVTHVRRDAGVEGERMQHEDTGRLRSEEHTSELQSQSNLVCRLLLEK